MNPSKDYNKMFADAETYFKQYLAHVNPRVRFSDKSECHQTKVDGANKAPVTCTVCQKTFHHRGNLVMHMRYKHPKMAAERVPSPSNGDQPKRCESERATSVPLQKQVGSGHTQMESTGVECKSQPMVVRLTPGGWTRVKLGGGDLLNFYATSRRALVNQICAFKKTHSNIKFVVLVQLEFEFVDTKTQKLYKQMFDFYTRETVVLEVHSDDYIRLQLDQNMFDLFEASQSRYLEWIKSFPSQ